MKTKKTIIREKMKSLRPYLDPSGVVLSNTNTYVGAVMRASRTGWTRDMKVALNKKKRKRLFNLFCTMAQR